MLLTPRTSKLLDKGEPTGKEKGLTWTRQGRKCYVFLFPASPSGADVADAAAEAAEQKKAADARKKQKVVEIKEIKLRPNIDDHDYDVKMRSVMRFFEEGDYLQAATAYRQILVRYPDDPVANAMLVEIELLSSGAEVP